MTSARCISGYIYAAASATESTKDVVYGGHSMIAETGQVLIESSRFDLGNNSIVADIDTVRCQGRDVHSGLGRG